MNAIPPISPAKSSDVALASAEVTRIRPSGGWRAIQLVELWRYRELIGFLALRDVKLRYKQTFLGVAWAVLQPLLNAAVFTIFFGRLAGISTAPGSETQPPYLLFALAGLLPWQLFAYALTQSSNSLVAERGLITKVYFPRLIVPLASVLSGLMDLLVTLPFVFAVMGWYAIYGGYAAPLSWNLLAIPLLTLFALLNALAVGMWLAAVNVQYRDVRYMLPFLAQFWMFVSPVAYPASLVPESYRALYGINPMVGAIEGFRWALLGTTPPDWGMMTVSALMTALLLGSGLLYFRRMETTFADVV